MYIQCLYLGFPKYIQIILEFVWWKPTRFIYQLHWMIKKLKINKIKESFEPVTIWIFCELSLMADWSVRRWIVWSYWIHGNGKIQILGICVIRTWVRNYILWTRLRVRYAKRISERKGNSVPFSLTHMYMMQLRM